MIDFYETFWGKLMLLILDPFLLVKIAREELIKEKKHVVILGPKGSGKTTLWRLLSGQECREGDTYPTLADTTLQTFELGDVEISAPVDVTGDLSQSQNAEKIMELLKSHPCVFVLFDIRDLSYEKRRKSLFALVEALRRCYGEGNVEKPILVATFCSKYKGDSEEYVKKIIQGQVKSLRDFVGENYIAGDLFDGKTVAKVKLVISNRA